MTFLTKQQEEIFKNITTIDKIELGEKLNTISFPIEKAQRIIDEFIAIPEIIPASIEEIEQVRKKICDNMNR